MIKKFYYPHNYNEYYIYYGVNDGNPVGLNPDISWQGLIRNEMVSSLEGRLVFNVVPTSIPDDAFAIWGDNNMTSISLPNTITSIGGGAFGSCTYLTSFTLYDCVTSVGVAAFGDTGITTPVYNSTIFALLPPSYSSSSYSIPSGITTIIGQAAWGCANLTSLIIPDSVTEIGDDAFNRCDNLTQIEIGSGITNIGHLAFLSLGAGGSFTCKATVPPTIDAALGNPGYGWTLYVPANSVSAYSADTKWSNEFVSIQAIPS